MMTSPPLILDYKIRSDASNAAAEMAQALGLKVSKERGRASLAVSGGSTPAPMFQSLSNADLDWSLVTLGLVDERSVPPEHNASNEALVRHTLMQNRAVGANFLPMWAEGEGQADARYKAHVPFDFILLGMGSDGHTASWFPGAKNLDDALEGNDHVVVAINASGCPVAGDITDRLSLTRSACRISAPRSIANIRR